VRTDFGRCAIVRFRFAVAAAFLIFFLAAFFCRVEAIFAPFSLQTFAWVLMQLTVGSTTERMMDFTAHCSWKQMSRVWIYTNRPIDGGILNFQTSE